MNTSIQFLIILNLFSIQALSQGDLLITPKRVVFENGSRSENLNLANIGSDTATFQISFEKIKMEEDGTFTRLKESDSTVLLAENHLRIFPRTITLAPKEIQTVKIQVSKIAELRDGEYRSHLYFRALNSAKPLGDTSSKNDSSINIKIVPTFGISIPAIIRVGKTSASVKIEEVSFNIEKDTLPVIAYTFSREGNQSVYGDIAVEYISPLGKVIRVSDVRGVAVYTPTPRRKMRIPLSRYAGADFSSGKLRITYSEQSPKNTILAQSEISLD